MEVRFSFLFIVLIALYSCLGCDDIVGMAIRHRAGDGGVDRDSDDASGNVNEINAITFDTAGWISADSNDLGIQGGWYWFHDKYDSTIDGAFATDSTVTVTGSAVPSSDGLDFAGHFGSKIGFNICATAPRDDDGFSFFSASECPYAEGLAEKLAGFRFRLQGTLPSTELRIQLEEMDRTDGTYVPVSGEGIHTVLFEDAKLYYDATADSFHPDALVAILFYISSTGGPTEFYFMISDLSFLVNP